MAILACWATWGATGLAEQPQAERDTFQPQMTVQVYNVARVSEEALSTAIQEATGIFSQAGVQTMWLDCPLTTPEALLNPLCLHRPPAELVVRILPHAEARVSSVLTPDTLGFALAPDKPERGFLASVYFDRVQQITEDQRGLEYEVLGRAIAHELGHLLLGTNSHSTRGIMRARWNPEELPAGSAGRFSFLPQQAAEIRAEVAARAQLTAQKQPGSDNLAASVK
jgi:hypothetical protein